MARDAICFVGSTDEAVIVPVLRRWRGARPRMGALVMLPEAESTAVERLQSLFRAERVPLVGAVFPSLVVDGHFGNQGAWLLRFDEMPFVLLRTELPRDGGDLASLAEELASELKPHLGAAQEITLLLLFDALFPRVGTLLDELYLRLQDRVHYMGANAGSETFKPVPCLFDAGRFIQGGLLAVVLKGSRGAVLEHGYKVPERMITATSTAGNRIMQIDWQPAFEVYRSMGRQLYGVEITRQNFYEVAVHFPFGIVRASGTVVVRIPVALDEDGSLFCVGEVPPNSVLALLAAPQVDSSRTVETLVNGLGEMSGPTEGKELLLFYCAGRRLHLGIPAAEAELRELGDRSKAAGIAGALSLGEIGSSTEWSYPMFHNATIVGTVWSTS
jgi:hypothetical protein